MFFPKLNCFHNHHSRSLFFLFRCPNFTVSALFSPSPSISTVRSLPPLILSILSNDWDHLPPLHTLQQKPEPLDSTNSPSNPHLLRLPDLHAIISDWRFIRPLASLVLTVLSKSQSVESPCSQETPETPSLESRESRKAPSSPQTPCLGSSEIQSPETQPRESPESGPAALLPNAKSSSASVLPFIISLFSMKPLGGPLLIVISGPSGSGKRSIIEKLSETRPNLRRVVSVTSREKRAGEMEGIDYVFVTKDEFLCMVDRGELLEYSLVYGDYKGIPRYKVKEHMAAGDDVAVRVDVQGAAKLRAAYGRAGAVFIFVVAESEAAGAERLVDRKTETSDGLLVRLKAAKEEVVHLQLFDYVVVNATHNLPAAAALVHSIIHAEKAKLRPTKRTPV